MSRPRVLFIGSFPEPASGVYGGQVTASRNLLDSPFSAAVELRLIDSSWSGAYESWSIRARRAAARLGAVLRSARGFRPDVALIFAAAAPSFLEKAAFVWVLRLLGIPSLLSIRSGHFRDLCERSPRFRSVARLLLRGPAVLLCQSEQWRTFFVEEMGVEPERCVVLENWAATPALLSLGAERPVRSGEPVTVCYMARVEPEKGIFELLEAVHRLHEMEGLPEFHVRIGGSGPALAAAREQARASGVADLIRFEGHLWAEGIEELLAKSDLYVLPSYTEGLPNSLLEAMAAGLPAVATEVGSVPDVVAHGRTGLLIAPCDVEALTTALAELIADDEKRLQMGRQAHLISAERFGVDAAALRLVHLIERLMDPVARGASAGRGVAHR